ncbi:MAG TPA: trehalose-phosphatase [Candidatus Sulfotelmatobacter sp.]|nr:trehalose-phosphatase [Candidatus Sulfotelmatobacter sp.]
MKPVLDLLKSWDDVAAQIRKRGRATIFLDFDGTLVDIAPRPELVRLKPEAREVLRRLSKHPLATLVLVSGRRRAELLEHIAVPDIHYFGLYGWERDDHCALPADAQKALRDVREALEPLLKKYPNLWIENKNSSLSVHLLAVPKALHKKLREELIAVLQPFQKKLHAVGNIRDVEILPRSIPGKGLAVREFLRDNADKKSLAFYFGDDFSDESGFVAVGRGVSVHVGKPRVTKARYRVKTPTDVAKVLARILGVLDGIEEGETGSGKARRAGVGRR